MLTDYERYQLEWMIEHGEAYTKSNDAPCMDNNEEVYMKSSGAPSMDSKERIYMESSRSKRTHYGRDNGTYQRRGT